MKLFTESYIIKSAMKDARRIRSTAEKAAIRIQKEIDFAAEYGRGETVVHTADFRLEAADRKLITSELHDAGYQLRWRDCDTEGERIHVWWEEEDA